MKPTPQKMLALILLCFTLSCTKKFDPAPEANEGYHSLKDFIAKNTVQSSYYTIDASKGDTITGPQGGLFTFQPGCFTDQLGHVISGQVKVELKELYQKSDMVLSNKVTQSYGSLLISGGEYYINATCNGSPVNAAVKHGAYLPSEDLQDNMKVFTGTVVDQTGTINWYSGYDSARAVTPHNAAPKSYFMSCDSLGWINCDKFAGFTNNALLKVHINHNPSNENTVIYMVYTDLNSVAQFTTYDASIPFSAHGPIGYHVTLVAVTLSNGTLYSSFVPMTIASDATLELSLSATTVDAFKSKLQLLN